MSKELNEEELDNVAGGVGNNYGSGNYTCPICEVLSRPIMKFNSWESLSSHLNHEHNNNSKCMSIINKADDRYMLYKDGNSAYNCLRDEVDGVMDPSVLAVNDNGGFKS